MKIKNDKYYTHISTAKYCIDKTFELIGKENITEIVEPSAGDGSFSNQINCIAYDIEPENENIFKQDYLTCMLEYKKGRLVIGNPPFGSKLNLALQFFKKSVNIADYISFILPISQLNNTSIMYEFDLIHSEDLGILNYSGIKLHCCFNIYTRPGKGLNAKTTNKLNDVKIIRQDQKNYEMQEFDLRLCYFGNGSGGKLLKEGEKYSGEYKIIILNEELKPQIINMFETINWREELKNTAMMRIKNYHIYDALRKYVPGIK